VVRGSTAQTTEKAHAMIVKAGSTQTRMVYSDALHALKGSIKILTAPTTASRAVSASSPTWALKRPAKTVHRANSKIA
jgi:hypothetical protein